MRIQRSLPVIGTALLATAGLALAQQGQSDPPLDRLVSDFQNTLSGADEVSTTNAALPGGAGGRVVYRKTFTPSATVNVIYVTFSAQGDVHNGSALLMNAFVNNTLVQPLLGQVGGGGGGSHVQTGWWTLLHPGN